MWQGFPPAALERMIVNPAILESPRFWFAADLGTIGISPTAIHPVDDLGWRPIFYLKFVSLTPDFGFPVPTRNLGPIFFDV